MAVYHNHLDIVKLLLPRGGSPHSPAWVSLPGGPHPNTHPGSLLSPPGWAVLKPLSCLQRGGGWGQFPPRVTFQGGDLFTQQMCPQA